MKTAVIYMFEAPEPSHNTGKPHAYIGQTWDLKKRIYFHSYESSECYALKNAIKKYGGIQNLKLTILHEGITDQEELNRLEVLEIKERNTLAPFGWNLTEGGSRGLHSEETKRRMSEAHKGKVFSPETCKKISLAKMGKKRSPESIAKTAAGNRGKKLSDEQKAAISRANKGKIVSAETRAKMSAYQKSRVHAPVSEETKEKHRINSTGRKASEETRAKMSAWQVGKKHSESTLKKLARASSRKVRCIELNRVFDSYKEADAFIGKSKGSVNHAARGDCPTAGGYHWERVNE